jgi:glycosyltransferase involved in cell wall biosynthesis
VGGTNPSLLEAMACSTIVCAHDNIFNKYILEEDAFYFSNAEEVAIHLKSIRKANETGKIKHNLEKIKNIYSLNNVLEQYKNFFYKICLARKKNNHERLVIE